MPTAKQANSRQHTCRSVYASELTPKRFVICMVVCGAGTTHRPSLLPDCLTCLMRCYRGTTRTPCQPSIGQHNFTHGQRANTGGERSLWREYGGQGGVVEQKRAYTGSGVRAEGRPRGSPAGRSGSVGHRLTRRAPSEPSGTVGVDIDRRSLSVLFAGCTRGVLFGEWPPLFAG